jgi:hypothetical protein
MSDEFSEQLSAYADGELHPAEREAMERHLGGCRECRQALSEIKAVVQWAPNYQGLAPSRDLWQDVETSLGTRPISTAPAKRAAWPGRRITVRAPLLAAAAVLLVLFGAIVTRLLSSRGTESELATPLRPARAWNVVTANATNRQYDAGIAELESILASNDTALDPETLRVIRESLATIDKAINDARAAIAQDSTNDYLNASIAHNMRRKLDILRMAAQAATAKS